MVRDGRKLYIFVNSVCHFIYEYHVYYKRGTDRDVEAHCVLQERFPEGLRQSVSQSRNLQHKYALLGTWAWEWSRQSRSATDSSIKGNYTHQPPITLTRCVKHRCLFFLPSFPYWTHFPDWASSLPHTLCTFLVATWPSP